MQKIINALSELIETINQNIQIIITIGLSLFTATLIVTYFQKIVDTQAQNYHKLREKIKQQKNKK